MQPAHPDLYPCARRWRDDRPQYGHLIANRWVDGDSLPISVTAPATGQSLAWLARGGATEIDAAVAAARAALDGQWGRTTAAERGRLMQAFAVLVLANQERLAWVEAHDTGKPISQARADMRAVARTSSSTVRLLTRFTGR